MDKFLAELFSLINDQMRPIVEQQSELDEDDVILFRAVSFVMEQQSSFIVKTLVDENSSPRLQGTSS